ncbi:MAG: hypothetical protein ACYTBZ_04775 [Planctomycetota bacterium]
MKIESGTTAERCTRISIFLALCIFFTAWFAYDGFVGYPAKNLEWAIQAMPRQPDDIRINPAVTYDKEHKIKNNMKIDELYALLGKPALEETKELVFAGREVEVIVRIQNKKVIEVIQKKVNPNDKPKNMDSSVIPEKISEIKPGMSENDIYSVGGKLGLFDRPPAEIRPRILWFVGRAAYLRVEVDDQKVKEYQFNKNAERSELSLAGQKYIAVALAIVSLIVAIIVYRIATLRVLLDDRGLAINKIFIPWEQMSGLITGQYADKGWIDLQYTSAGESKTLRLDSYHIKLFDDIVGVICQKKGFDSPLPELTDDMPADHSA